MPHSSIFRELVTQMMINDQRLGDLGIHNRWRSAASLIHDEDILRIFG